MRYCKDCKFNKIRGFIPTNICKAVVLRRGEDPQSGPWVSYHTTTAARWRENPCGPKGKLFQPTLWFRYVSFFKLIFRRKNHD